MKELVRYEVIDKRGRWMGNYAAEFERRTKQNVFEMARINAQHSNGKILAVYSDGSKEEVWPTT